MFSRREEGRGARARPPCRDKGEGMDDDFLDRIDELVAKAANGKHAPRKHGSQEESPASRRKCKGGKERHSPQSTSEDKGPTKRQKAASRSSDDSDDDFKPAAKVPPPPVFTRTLKLGSKTTVTVKEVTSKIGAHRMLKALDGRKAIVWNLLMWDRSDTEENVEEKENPSEHGELPGEGAGLSPPKLKISDPADKIRGLAVAAEVGTVWYLPFDEDQAVCNAKLILTSGSQRKAAFCSAAPLAAMVRAGCCCSRMPPNSQLPHNSQHFSESSALSFLAPAMVHIGGISARESRH